MENNQQNANLRRNRRRRQRANRRARLQAGGTQVTPRVVEVVRTYAPPPPQPMRPPGRRRNLVTPRNQNTSGGGVNSRVVSGHDVLRTITVDSKTMIGKTLFRITLGPRFFAGTRLYQESTLWSRWKPLKFTLQVRSAASAMISGAYVVGWTSTHNPIHGVQSVRQVMAYTPSQYCKISQDASLVIPTKLSQALPVDATRQGDTAHHGEIVGVLSAALSNMDGAVALTLSLNWQVAFEGPKLDEADASGDIGSDVPGPFTFEPDPGFDENRGLVCRLGSAAPFSRAEAGVVYALKSGQKLTGSNGDNRFDVGFFVRVQPDEMSYPILTGFTDLDSARRYAAIPARTMIPQVSFGGADGTPDDLVYSAVPDVPLFATGQAQSLESQIVSLERQLSSLRMRSTRERGPPSDLGVLSPPMTEITGTESVASLPESAPLERAGE